MNRSYDSSAQSPKVKCSAAYSMGREFGEKHYCAIRTVLEGADPIGAPCVA